MARKPKQQELRPNADLNVIAETFADYSDFRGEIARIGQKIQRLQTRSEAQGVDFKAIKHAYAESQKDPNVVAAQEKKNAEYLRILDIIDVDRETGQGTMMPGLKVAKPTGAAADKFKTSVARADGYNAGLSGSKIDACPTARWPVGSEGYVAWRDGWEEGHADRVAKKPENANVTKASTSRKRGGKTSSQVAGDGRAEIAEGEQAEDKIGEPVGSA